VQEELELNLEKYSVEVKEELRYLLMDLLKYPSTKQAYRHRCANRLGYNDLKHIKNKLRGDCSYTSSHFHPDYCQDCGLLIQQREISTCSSLWEFPKAGIATYHLYKDIKVTLGFLFLLSAIYTILNLYANILVSR
jgi:predicted Zn-ribbon and HTH transcriptional regulator